MSRYPEIDTAYLVRKHVRYLPEWPFFVLAIVPRRRWLKSAGGGEDRELLQSVLKFVNLPESCYVMVLSAGSKSLRIKLQREDGAVVYHRG